VCGVTDIIWSPTREYIERANVTRLMRTHGIETYEALVERSIADAEWFWDAVVRDLDIEFFEPYRQVRDISRGVEWATWFRGGRVGGARGPPIDALMSEVHAPPPEPRRPFHAP